MVVVIVIVIVVRKFVVVYCSLSQFGSSRSLAVEEVVGRTHRN